jgi:tetratricopeptide (TPR) repeat protein
MGFVFAGKLRCGSLVPLLLALCAADVRAFAVEPAAQFVKGLEARGLHTLALEYLEDMKTSPLANEAVRRQIPYLRGEALIEQSRHSPDPAVRTRLLDEARQELERFVEANPHSIDGAEAQLQLATVQMTRGQELVAQALQLPKGAAYDAQRKSFGHDARVMFAEARDTFGRAEAIYSAELDKLPPTTSAEARSDTGSKRQEYRSRVAQLRFLAAQTRFEEARSYPPTADEFRKLNETAAQDLSTIYDEFARTMLVGLYARLYEGRCYQAMGKFQEALGCYEELIGKDNVLPQFRKLIASAIHRKAEVLVAQQKYDAAIEACRICVKDAHKDEATQPEWIGVRFQLAQALLQKGEVLPAASAEHRKLVVEAREAYRTVAKTPSEYQLAARTAAAKAGSDKKSGENEKNNEEPKTFQGAYELGKDALASYNSAKMAIPSAEKNNPEAVPELQTQMNQGKEDARRLFRQAISLVDSDTDPKQVNEVRYFLCWLYWESGDYYRAAVLGEFIVQRYPNHPAAGSAAKIAMASFERLYNSATTSSGKRDNGEFEGSHMAQMAELIAKRSPGTDDADSAFAVLVSYAIRSGRIDQAEKLVGEASTKAKPRLELQLGNAIWARYLDVSRAAQSTAPDETAVQKLKAPAVKYLRNGFDNLRKEKEPPASDLGVMTGLYLAQALLSDAKYAEAIDVLEDEKAGPLKLIAHGNAIAARPEYAIEAYKTAMWAYVSMSPPQEDKAVDTMQSLEKAVKARGDAAKSAEQLNLIYMGLGTALQKQVEELRAAGKDTEAKRVSTAFAKFVDRVSSQPGANWAMRVWLGQTYLAMANDRRVAAKPAGTANVADAPLDNVSRVYYSKARDTYLQLIKEAASDPKLAPSGGAVLLAKMRLAESYRALRQYDKAIDAFSEILKEKEASLEVQRAAATTYAERGQHDDPKWFENAIHGGNKAKPNGQNLVWGWVKISTVSAQAARKDTTFRDSFFDARLNIARCRYQAAMKKEGDARRDDLSNAKLGIQSLARIYPDYGGERWKPQFEDLLRDIKREEDKLPEISDS